MDRQNPAKGCGRTFSVSMRVKHVDNKTNDRNEQPLYRL